VVANIACQNHDAVKFFHFLQEVVHFNVGIAATGVFDFRALSKQGIGLIKKKDGIALFRLLKDPDQVLFGLPDILAYYTGKDLSCKGRSAGGLQ
jgi:hypothetical protein